MGVAALVGLAGGGVAILLHFAVGLADGWILSLHLPLWAKCVLPILGGLVCGFLVYPWAPEAAGQGIDATIDAFHNQGGNTRKRVAPLKFLASLATIASGGSGGYEGPVSQIGGGVASTISGALKMPLPLRRMLLLAGTAAGLGAVFKAPLGAALTSVEMLYKEDFESSALGVYMEHSGAAWAASAWESALPDEPTLESWLNWIERDGVLYTLGMEVFGLPDLCAPLRLGTGEELRSALTAIADTMFFEGLKTLPELQKEADKLHDPSDPYHNPRGRFRLLKAPVWERS
jgi:hypothetical protein